MKKIFTLSLLLITAIFSYAQNTPVGSGTESDPYQISTLDNLVWLAKTDSIWDDGAYFIQTADIDASATDTMTIAGFNPGWSAIGNAITSFRGTYDGGGYTIDGLVTHGNSANGGLFGMVKALDIKDLGLTNINMAVGSNSGALVGHADSLLIVDNCYATGNLVIDGTFSGGLIGFIQNSKFNITNSHTDVNVLNIHVGTNAYAGGFLGYIELTGDNDMAGIIENCYSTGDVSLTDQAGKYGYAGGFIARTGGDQDHQVWSEIRRCYSTGNVTGVTGTDGNTYSPAGGFIGNVNWRYKVSECYSTGNVTSIGKDAGGFIGYLKYEARVENCYSTGNVTRVSGSTQPNFGGFIGSQNAWGSSPVFYSVVKNCYTVGSVTGTDINGYGFFGHQASACIDSSNYWNKETSGQDSTVGNAIGLTTAEMKTQSSFVGWDFENIWEIVGDNYPTFQEEAVVLPVTNAAKPEGSGTETDPYQIANLANLSWLAQTDSAWGMYFIQTADIDASETATWDDADDNGDGDKYNDQNDVKEDGNNEGWSPIGTETNFFTGVYEGNDHVINGLTINRPTTNYIGFFGNIRKDFGTDPLVQNLGLTNISYVGAGYVGGFTGQNEAAKIINCYTTGSVKGVSDDAGYVAGFVGYNKTVDALIHRCHSDVAVTYTGHVKDAYIGGFAGRNRRNSFITECYSTGDVVSSGLMPRAGGFVGQIAFATVLNCYSTGSLTYSDSLSAGSGYSGAGTQIGGFTGRSYTDTVKYCYSVGQVIADSAYGRGFIGTNNNHNVYVGNFLDTLASGLNQSAIDSAATELATSDMKNVATFTAAGWDFENIWEINGDNYPTFKPYVVSIKEKQGEVIPSNYVLEQNYPNPFNPTTVIKFSLPKASEVTLSVYNILGQKVVSLVNKELAQGTYEYQFDASNLTSGIYFYKLQANKYSQVKKMLLIK